MTDQSLELAQALRRTVEGEVLFDSFTRGRYSTDASIYQIEPIGVVVPKSIDDAIRALELALEHDTAILPRGAGSSQCGQTVGHALVIDHSKYLNAMLELDTEARTVWVEPGIVLDDLNRQLKPHGLWFPVDVSTSAQATIGGMTANNSCGARSIRYGNMVHNVNRVEMWLTSGETVLLGPTSGYRGHDTRSGELAAFLRDLYIRERDEIAARVPRVQRRVAGYNLDMAAAGPFNLAHIAVGSEGTLGFFKRIQLQLAPLPQAKVLGVVHFPSFSPDMQSWPLPSLELTPLVFSSRLCLV